MERYYVIGAKQKNQVLKDWEQYERGLILDVFPEKKLVKKCVDYQSPPEVCPAVNPSHSFTAGSIRNNHLYVGTHTEVIKYRLPEFVIEKTISLPCFNDIHHVKPLDDGNLLVVNTGLDMVIKLSENGEVLNEWNVMGEQPWDRFSRKTDYRKVPTTKPHHSHPNYAFTVGEDLWVTRCLQKDAICLSNNKRIDIGRQLVHDGVVFGDSIYFTQVDGSIVIVDSQNYKVKKVHNLNKLTRTNSPLGWCRGIKVISHDKVIVGFTRIRPSKKVLPNGKTKWEGQYGVLPTRIACFDLKREEKLWEQELEDVGLNAIYSIHSISN
ncbi:hypothetical protein [Halalkalibacterium halodurans]|uniref:Uncharacterized protein n=1 Tax=Halalkalibacterium halodurans TaxID=86665 RepID=A0A0M0KGC3_ALKHA|nr:hypothetical protein [Halalkalibacterium halodurans]TPE68332.1 hypothetical protein AMD02_014025 [Halalkalibacterium halodurans]